MKKSESANMDDLNSFSIDDIRQCLKKESSITYDIPGSFKQSDCRQAAVLIPFVEINNEWHLLFIRRSEHELDHHSGQVAFAGGKYEPDDDNLQFTALREAQEEIGLSPVDVTVLGQLKEHHSISRFSITPVVAHIPWPYKFKLDHAEVARVFTIPLSWLTDTSNYRIEQRKIADHKPVPVAFFERYDGEQLWGASARMTLSLLELLKP